MFIIIYQTALETDECSDSDLCSLEVALKRKDLMASLYSGSWKQKRRRRKRKIRIKMAVR